jgi:hypothetical protein
LKPKGKIPEWQKIFKNIQEKNKLQNIYLLCARPGGFVGSTCPEEYNCLSYAKNSFFLQARFNTILLRRILIYD